MLIREVCKACKLTKKAIEYYTESGLISPGIMENRYRDFSETDLARLKKIAVLRGLGLSVSDTQMVLADPERKVLPTVAQSKEMEISELQEKQKLIEKLARDGDWDSVHAQLEMLELKQSIFHRLLGMFPGYYGKYLSLHFAPFLNEPITTEEQQEAFQTIISFLDGSSIVVPDDLKEHLDETVKDIIEIVPEIAKSRSIAINNTEQYLADNKDELEQYMAYIKSDEFKQSPAFRLKELLTQFYNQSGYYDIFIPAMRRLSNSYKQYHDDLLKANELFVTKYGAKFS